MERLKDAIVAVVAIVDNIKITIVSMLTKLSLSAS